MAICPKCWELIERFKDYCQSRGWETSDREDWVRAGDEYHNFLWIQTVHPSTFEKVALNSRCAIREGAFYRVVDVSYMAWVLPKAPPKRMTRMVAEEPRLSRRIAIYDLSEAYAGRPICLKLNETKSVVFQEFEKFLGIKYKINLRPIYKLPPLPPEFVPPQPEKLGLSG